jgi:hypothetical protein
LARGGADKGDGRHSTLEDGQKWPWLLHMAEKHLKKTQRKQEKHVKEEEEIMKGERVKGESRRELLPPGYIILLLLD